MPHACSAPTARWVKCRATVMVAWATIPSMVAVNTEVPSERAVTTPGPLMETTGGADELKVIEGFVIRRPLTQGRWMTVRVRPDTIWTNAPGGRPASGLAGQPG